MKLRTRTTKSTPRQSKVKIKRKVWREEPGAPRKYSSCGFQCPACKKDLPARSYGPNNRNVEAHTPEGWVLVSVSGDDRLPCPICLAFLQGHDKSNWHKATLEPGSLHSSLKARPRQHWSRKHKTFMRTAEGDGLKTYATLLVCPLLHEKEVADSQPQVNYP